jgi:hypothetical protein
MWLSRVFMFPFTVADAEKKYQRFKELFSTMFAQYKEAVYLLTGFKLERVGGGAGGPGGAPAGGGAATAAMYRLRSMYGEREDDHLLFQIDDRCVSACRPCRRV